VSAITPNETTHQWKAAKREAGLQIYLSSADGDTAEFATARIGGLPVTLNILPTTEWINPDELAGAAAAVIQVDADTAASVKRFEKLAQSVETPLIAASYDPPLALVRTLLRSGAQDVVPLPLNLDEVEAALSSLTLHVPELAEDVTSAPRLISAIKSVGGVGATALLSQLAIRFARNEAKHGREVCLIDLDVQFGDVAFQLGLQPRLSLSDLLDAGTRLDGDLLRATTVEHPSGLKVIAAPKQMMPLESIGADHVLEIVDVAAREFGTVFVDLPTNWTNWSLSLVARSALVLVITELTVTGLNRARRQLDVLESEELGVDVRVVLNRFDKTLAKTVSTGAATKALGRDIAYTISNDFRLMRAAMDRGVPIDDIKRKTVLGKDLDVLDAGIAAALSLER
jgi:pilus assembly protein CpaE